MSLLLPAADGIADFAEQRVPSVPVLRYGAADADQLADVTFYCLPYMGDAASIALISALPALRVVQSLSNGVDEVLGALPATATLCNGRGLQHEEGTAELAMCLLLASLRGLPAFIEQQAKQTWHHTRTDTIAGKRVLLLGYGPIGIAIEQRLAAFGALITRVSRTPRPGVAPLRRLPDLAASADILVICIALAPQTRGIVDEAVLGALPTGALVVNVARGPVVEPSALLRELESGRLRAALDVIDTEPLPASRPEWALPNVLVTPHIGGDTFAFGTMAPQFVASQVASHLAGDALRNVVRPALAAS